MGRELDNAAPTIFETQQTDRGDLGLWSPEYEASAIEKEEQEGGQPIDAAEIFDLIRSITDPEHPISLEKLRVVSPEDVQLKGNRVLVYLTPTIPHCSMSTLIGLSLRVRLLRALPPRYRVEIRIKPGTHQSEHAVNKQLNDKERVQAALENNHLLQVVDGCLATAGKRGKLDEEESEALPVGMAI